MELSPKAINGVQFRVARKGYDPEEVRSFLGQLARGVEAMHGQAAAADARARSAMAKVQELTAARAEADPSESMARTLVLAQKTADAVVAEANEEAKAMVAAAEEKARAVGSDAQARAEQLVTDAEAEARRAGSAEKARLDAEVAALTARRDELHAEATRLEALIATQRQRVGEAADALRSLLDGGGADAAILVAEPVPAPTPAPSPDPAPVWSDTASPAVATDAPTSEPADDAPDAEPSAPAEPVHAAAEADAVDAVAAGDDVNDDDDDIAGELALMAEPSGRARLPFGEPAAAGPPTAEVPVVDEDQDRVRDFFEPEPFADDRWMRQRGRD
jgi:DivIVA domain-containing protein